MINLHQILYQHFENDESLRWFGSTAEYRRYEIINIYDGPTIWVRHDFPENHDPNMYVGDPHFFEKLNKAVAEVKKLIDRVIIEEEALNKMRSH